MKVIHFSRFVPAAYLGGGARRTLQVVELLESFRPRMISTARAGGIHNSEPPELGEYFEDLDLQRYFSETGELKYWSTFSPAVRGVRRREPMKGADKNRKAYRLTEVFGNPKPFFQKAPLRGGASKTVYSTGNNFQASSEFPTGAYRAPAPRAWPPEGQKYWSEGHREMAERLHAVSAEWAETLDFSQLELAFVDDPIYFLPLLGKLKKEGIPVVAVSHNIESLAAHQVEPRYRKHLFSAELAALAACDLVISISREETWLFRNFGMNALFLPYYPPRRILDRMRRVRKRRERSKKKDFLLIGSAVNAATRQGILDAVSLWREKELYRGGDRLLVAGYMSDVFLRELKAGAGPQPKNRDKKNSSLPGNPRGPAGLSPGDSIEFFGPLADEDLDDILSRVKAGIVYQQSGSGALTRIAEMLTAAVPVLANSHAARSYYDMEGVVEFRDLAGMGDFFARVERLAGRVPMPPQPDASSLISQIKKLCLRGCGAPTL